MSRTVAALYVLPDGPYAGREDIDLWPESRDARLYAGPHPVVAHPPCGRWGRFWDGGPAARGRYQEPGMDDGCFAAALAAVRLWGGVLEHPAGSYAFRYHGIRPPSGRGWQPADLLGGWACLIEQGAYGHPCRKPSWLFTSGIPGSELPELPWGNSADLTVRTYQSLSHRQRTLTPDPFATLLLDLARLTSRTLTP